MAAAPAAMGALPPDSSALILHVVRLSTRRSSAWSRYDVLKTCSAGGGTRPEAAASSPSSSSPWSHDCKSQAPLPSSAKRASLATPKPVEW
jgi:hypothetical protein